MKKIIFSMIILLCAYGKAQVVPLSSTENISNGMYFKDLDNLLPRFIGQWTAKYEKNQIILNIEKVDKYPAQVQNAKYNMDVLLLRYTIKDSQGKEIFSTLNKDMRDESVLKSSSSSSENKSSGFQYEGEECRIGEGLITLTYKDPTHVSWEYLSTESTIDKTKCPNADNIKSYIPKAYELIFTKQ
jgi:hypothetical protein